MRIIEGQTFTGTVVVMDETYFRKCRLERCQLVYCGGDYGWLETEIIDCSVNLQGTAARVHQFLKETGLANEPDAKMPPIVNTSSRIH